MRTPIIHISVILNHAFGIDLSHMRRYLAGYSSKSQQSASWATAREESRCTEMHVRWQSANHKEPLFRYIIATNNCKQYKDYHPKISP